MTTHGESLTYEDLQKAADIAARLRGQEQSVLTHWGRTVLEGDAAAEIERLRAALAEARDVMMELHNDLRDTIIKEYAGTTQYPSQAIKYDRDMEPCRRADRWLERNP